MRKVAPDEGDVTKLPKWAQRKIESLEHRVDSLERLVDDTRTSFEPTNVKVSRLGPLPGSLFDVDWGLPVNSEIDFYLGEDVSEKWHNTISVRHYRTKPGVLHVNSSGGVLTVQPAGGCNSLYLSISRF